jgi:hypothetical protein
MFEESIFDDLLSSDLTLRIVQYLNVVDSGQLANTSQRYYYLVHKYRDEIKGPELTISTSSKFEAGKCMIKDCTNKLQTRPNLVLSFSSIARSSRISTSTRPTSVDFDRTFPSKYTISLGAIAHEYIQVNQPSSNASSASSPSPPIIEHTSAASLMAMHFPNAKILPFAINEHRPEIQDLEFLEQRLLYHNTNSEPFFWKAMILYVVGDSVEASDKITKRMQKIMGPNAVIVGGVCKEGYVSKSTSTYTKHELNSMSITNLRYILKNSNTSDKFAYTKQFPEKSGLVEYVLNILKEEEEVDNNNTMIQINRSGAFGVFLGGNVPVKSVVSRGVHSVLSNNVNSTNLIVTDVSLLKPGDEDFLFGSHEQPPIHFIRKIKDTQTSKIYTPIELLSSELFESSSSSSDDTDHYDDSNFHGVNFEFIGLKRNNGMDGFELSNAIDVSTSLFIDAFIVPTDGSDYETESLLGAEIDFFTLNGKSCMEDMDRTMSKVKDQTKNEQILGALMYTCCGRGPDNNPGFISEEMSDAKRFANKFPDVPCLGFYANGEFGPIALAGNNNVFQTGRALHQGVSTHRSYFIYNAIGRFHSRLCSSFPSFFLFFISHPLSVCSMMYILQIIYTFRSLLRCLLYSSYP